MFDKVEFDVCLTRAQSTPKKLAEAMGISESTLYRKIKSGDFSRSEMSRIAEILKMKNPLRVFFADELAFSQVISTDDEAEGA